MVDHKDAVHRIEAQLDVNLQLQRSLKDQEDELRRALAQADVPPPPPSEHSMFLVEVRFAEGGAIYEYLIHRSINTDHWCTTGSKPEQKRFTSWEKLCQWLNSTYWHSNLSVLTVAAPREFPTQFDQTPPF